MTKNEYIKTLNRQLGTRELTTSWGTATRGRFRAKVELEEVLAV